MKLRMRIYKRKNGFWYYEIQRNKPRSLRTKDEREARKLYKIIKRELDFYRDKKLPIPHECPYCRYKKRLKMRNSRKLYDRKCNKCQKAIQTTYSPDRPDKVYCEACYLKEVY